MIRIERTSGILIMKLVWIGIIFAIQMRTVGFPRMTGRPSFPRRTGWPSGLLLILHP